MTNGTLHIRQYLGSHDFRRSIDFEKYSDSPFIKKIIGPIMVHKSVDHAAIIRRKAER